MQAKLIGVVFPKGGRRAALLMRRGDGQFAISGIDARLGSAWYAATVLNKVSSLAPRCIPPHAAPF